MKVFSGVLRGGDCIGDVCAVRGGDAGGLGCSGAGHRTAQGHPMSPSRYILGISLQVRKLFKAQGSILTRHLIKVR